MIRTYVSFGMLFLGLVLALGCGQKEKGGGGPGGGPGGGGMAGGPGGGRGGAMGPVSVTVATAARKTVPLELRAFGTVEANRSVSLRPQVTGVLTDLSFQPGQEVKQGDFLGKIDSGIFDAALRQAEAVLARDQAQYRYAAAEAVRQAELGKSEISGQAVIDQARAVADALAATVKGDEAAVQRAKIDLEYCSLRASIGGRIGDWLVDPGNTVKANDLPVALIHQVKPIQVGFTVPAQHLGEIRKRLAENRLEVQVLLSGGGTAAEPEKGDLTFVDNSVDTATGTLKLKATFANAAEKLWPGQFVTVALRLMEQAGALTVPSAAVTPGQRGPAVFVVKEDLTVEPRPVVVDRTYGTESLLSSGVEEGERVVTDGQLLLMPAAKVVIKEEAPAGPGNSGKPGEGPGKGEGFGRGEGGGKGGKRAP